MAISKTTAQKNVRQIGEKIFDNIDQSHPKFKQIGATFTRMKREAERKNYNATAYEVAENNLSKFLK